jgi:hypothetical protein
LAKINIGGIDTGRGIHQGSREEKLQVVEGWQESGFTEATVGEKFTVLCTSTQMYTHLCVVQSKLDKLGRKSQVICDMERTKAWF